MDIRTEDVLEVTGWFMLWTTAMVGLLVLALHLMGVKFKGEQE